MLYLVMSIYVYSQNRYINLQGTLSDTIGGMINSVNICLLDSDSTMLGSCISDSTGRFTLKYLNQNVNYPLLLSFSHIEYEPKNLIINSDSLNWLRVIMHERVHKLPEIAVQGNWIRHKNGNVVVDVSQIPGANTFQVDKLLQQLPGITKSQAGGYELNGRPVVFYLNGVKQNITQQSLDAFLSSMQASTLSEIQLVDINSGKYPADSNHAFVELKTNKNIVDGYSHQFTLSASVFEQGLKSWLPSYFYMVKKGKWMFYNTISFTDNNNYGVSRDSVHYSNGISYANRMKNGGRYPSVTYNAKWTYTFSNENFLDLSAYVYDDFGHIYSDILSTDYESNLPLMKRILYYKTFENDDLWTGTVSYIVPETKKKFHGTVYYNILYGGLRTDNEYYEFNNKYQTSNLEMTGWMNTLAADFGTEWDKLRLEYGVNGQYNWLHDDTDYNFVQTGAINRSRFYGREILTSAYLTSYYEFNKKITAAAALRLENTDYKIEYRTENYNSHKNYTNYFPMLYVFYTNEKYNGTFALLAGINRPKYEYMIPGIRKVTETFYTMGNPEANPSKNYSVLFNSVFFKFLNLNLGYTYFKDVSGKVYEERNGILYQHYLNYADVENYKISLNLPFRLFQGKLYGQLLGNCTYVNHKKFFNGYVPPVGRKDNYWLQNYSVSMSYDIAERFNFNAYFQYSPAKNALYYHTCPRTDAEAGISYQFLKKKNLILYFNVGNIFDSNDIKENIYFMDNFRTNVIRRHGPVFTLSVRLKLDKGQKVIEQYKDYMPNVSRMLKD